MTARLKYSYDVDLADPNTAATKVIQFVGARRRILEVGAGPGSISRILKQRFGCDVTAIELDEAAVRELETFCDRVHQADLNAEGWADCLRAEAPFEFIIAADVLEHLIDPLAALRSLTPLLAAEGHIIVSLPNAAHSGLIATLFEGDFRYGEWGLLDRTHVRFFGPRNVDALLDAAGLEIIAREYVTRHPLQTEFADCWNRLEADERALLARRAGGNIYQIVVKARPHRAQSARPTLVADGSRAGEALDVPGTRATHPTTEAAGEPRPGAPLPELMLTASDSQEAGDLQRARRLFLRAISEYGENFDALHMLGVIELEQDDPGEALRFLQRALPLLQVDFPPFFRNLGLCLAALKRATKPPTANAKPLAQQASRIYRRNDLPPRPGDMPLVSVVVASNAGDRNVADSIASVRAQSYPNIELIVANGPPGASDGIDMDSAGPIPLRSLRLDASHIGTRINQCVAEARGRYVALLDAGDRFAPSRIDHLVHALAGSGARWGFSNMAFVDKDSHTINFGEQPEVDLAMRAHESLLGRLTLSEGIMRDSVVVSGSNLFFEHSLWREVGGFGTVRFHVDWLFALAVTILAEPIYIDEPDYVRRIVDAVPGAADAEARAVEEGLIRERWLNHLDSARHIPNRLLEQAKQLRRQYDFAIMGNGGGHLLDRRLLLRYLHEMNSASPPAQQQSR
jgi:2-polyprenyl-3-methyl-5-hydroxy-6-metoxy-1,4-benzoquinol methylase/glycosyltransferase involved in cell wall biosynthesis